LGQNPMKSSGDKEYLISGRWKCEKSPSGAHHWMVARYEMTCRYCNDNRQMNDTRLGVAKPETK
jgi:hypothetical protein